VPKSKKQYRNPKNNILITILEGFPALKALLLIRALSASRRKITLFLLPF
jgi:hypothetical protein